MDRVVLAAAIVISAIGIFLFFDNTVNAQEAEQPPQESPAWITGDSFSVNKLTLKSKTTGEITEVLYVEGGFNDGITDAVRKAIEETGITKVALSSPGGLVYEAFSMAYLFSDMEVTPWVPQGRWCLSACAVAFMGGSDYELEGTLGYHVANIGQSVVEPNQINALYANGQATGAWFAHFVLTNGFSFDLVNDVVANTDVNKFLTFDTTSDLMKYYVRDDEAGQNDKFVNYFNTQHEAPVLTTQELITVVISELTSLSESGGRFELVNNELLTEVMETKDEVQ